MDRGNFSRNFKESRSDGLFYYSTNPHLRFASQGCSSHRGNFVVYSHTCSIRLSTLSISRAIFWPGQFAKRIFSTRFRKPFDRQNGMSRSQETSASGISRRSRWAVAIRGGPGLDLEIIHPLASPSARAAESRLFRPSNISVPRNQLEPKAKDRGVNARVTRTRCVNISNIYAKHRTDVFVDI